MTRRAKLITIKSKSLYDKICVGGCLPIYYKYNSAVSFKYKLVNTLSDILLPNKIKQKLLNKLMVSVKISVPKFETIGVNNNKLLAELHELGNFSYIPNPGNLGDCLIAKATYDFFDDNHLSYQIYQKGYPKNIVYGGGGIFIKGYESAYKKYFNIFNHAEKVVILSSSFYQCEELVQILDKRFVVFCRERQSYDYLINKKTKAKIILDHDMALRLTHKHFENNYIKINLEQRCYYNLNCQKIKALKNKVVHLLRSDTEKDNAYPTHYDLSLAYCSKIMSKEEVDFAARLCLSTVAQFDKIVTDRLHIGISSALMGQEVYLLDNSYKKLSSVYENSLKGLKNVHICEKFPKNL